jgi:hypothetical protein
MHVTEVIDLGTRARSKNIEEIQVLSRTWSFAPVRPKGRSLSPELNTGDCKLKRIPAIPLFGAGINSLQRRK